MRKEKSFSLCETFLETFLEDYDKSCKIQESCCVRQPCSEIELAYKKGSVVIKDVQELTTNSHRQRQHVWIPEEEFTGIYSDRYYN